MQPEVPRGTAGTMPPTATDAIRAKVEPPAEMRTMAKVYAGFFVALRDEGFTEGQSMELLKAMIMGASAQPRPPTGGPT